MQIPEINHYFKVLVAKEVDDHVETTGDDMEDAVYATKEEAVAVADKEALDPTCISAIVIEHKDFPIYEIRPLGTKVGVKVLGCYRRIRDT